MTSAVRPSLRLPIAWLLAALLLLLGSGLAAAARIAEQDFEDRIRIADADLVLNGVGVRAVAWLKGYAAGLYLAERARTAEAALAVKGPKRIQMKMLVDVEAKEFVKAFDKGMRRNHTPAEQQAMQDRMLRLHDLIAQMGPLKKGDVVNLDFVPGTGLVLTVNGASRGSPVPGEDLYAGVMKIFIGDDPVDKNLKAGLLGNPA
jgi:hypothetical protein